MLRSSRKPSNSPPSFVTSSSSNSTDHDCSNGSSRHDPGLPLHHQYNADGTTSTSSTAAHNSRQAHHRHRHHHRYVRYFGRAKSLRSLPCVLLVAIMCFLSTVLVVKRNVFTTAATATSNNTFNDMEAEKATHRNLEQRHPQQLPQGAVATAAPLPPPRLPTRGVYDVAVLGAGPAGLTAALFAARAGLSVLVLGSDAGLLSETPHLDNFPSWTGASNSDGANRGGPSWLATTKQQARQLGATFAQAGLLVSSLQQQKDNGESPIFSLELDQPGAGAAAKNSNNNKSNNYNGGWTAHARSVVLAMGATGRRLGVPLEDELWGRSVHSCAICDGSMYAGKTVVVVGGGDAAVDGALLLARHAQHVILVHRRDEFRATNQRNLLAVRNSENISVRTSFVVDRLETRVLPIGTDNNNPRSERTLVAVQLQNVDKPIEKHRVPCDGIFVMIGATPNTHFLNNATHSVALDDEGMVKLRVPSLVGDNNNPDDEDMGTTMTTLPGVFAAGEITDKHYRQAITAAAGGAQAAIDAERWLRSHPLRLQERRFVSYEQDNLAIPVLQFDPNPHDPSVASAGGMDNDCDVTQPECIRKLIEQFPVVVFSKPRCPECQRLQEYLTAEGLPENNPKLHYVNIVARGTTKSKQIRAVLQDMTGRKSVPNMFIGGKNIGGWDEVQSLHHQGQLRSLLEQANAVDAKAGAAAPPSPTYYADVECDLKDQSCITKLVRKYGVVVFSKPWCPYCRRALEALALEGLAEGDNRLHIVDLSLMGQYTQQVQAALQAMTGRRTVPNVFVGGSSIGGGDETSTFRRQGKLRTMLVQAHALEDETGARDQSARELSTQDGDQVECGDLTLEKCINQLVHQFPVVVFMKPGCPFCVRAREALAMECLPDGHRNLRIVNLMEQPNVSGVQDRLLAMTGRRTVPNVFIGGDSIGGGTEMVQLQQKGELRTLLVKARAVDDEQNSEREEI